MARKLAKVMISAAMAWNPGRVRNGNVPAYPFCTAAPYIFSTNRVATNLLANPACTDNCSWAMLLWNSAWNVEISICRSRMNDAAPRAAMRAHIMKNTTNRRTVVRRNLQHLCFLLSISSTSILRSIFQRMQKPARSVWFCSRLGQMWTSALR